MTDQLEAAVRGLLISVLIEVAREVLPAQPTGRVASPSTDPFADRMLLRPTEVTKRFAISDRTLHAMTRSGEIPSVRIGRLVRYCPESLRQWIQEAEAIPEPVRDSTQHRQRVNATKDARANVGSTRKPPTKAATSVAELPRRHRALNRPNTAPERRSVIEETRQNRPRSIISMFADPLGVPADALPEMTNGDIMRIAEVDVPTLHGWTYHNGRLPDQAITKLHDYFVAYLRRS